mmetsp:Transcript_27408/g.49338  ORF Transcript_27408/g.49338 Transcript_27408/m.49338 type:complete len:300 (-) Transcript_27408:626-1525(-)
MDETELAETLQLLRIDPAQRTKEQVQRITNNTIKLPYFHDIQHEPRFSNLHKSACSHMLLEEFREGQVVVRYGDYADTFYLVIKGELGVYIPKKKLKATVDAEEEEQATPHSSPYKEDYADQKLIEVATLTEGGHFGELSLLRGLARTATVECKKDSFLGVLHIRDFRVSLGIFEERKLNYKIDFLQSLPVFRQWTKTAISKMTYFLQTHTCGFGSILYRERHDSDAVYIVEEGEFRLTQQAVIKQKSSQPISFLYGPRKAPCEKSLKPLMNRKVKTKRKDLQVRWSLARHQSSRRTHW